jgi:hypothetical protein
MKFKIMNDTHLLELSQFQFPSIGIDKLKQEPYLSDVRLYKEMYSEFKFYRGFVHLNGIERAKIYRAISLSCDDNISMKDFIMFTTDDGLIIKYHQDKNLEDFTYKFEHYISQGNNYVLVPGKCDKLDKYNYCYYRRMLNNFISNERIPGKALRMNENNSILLFLSLDEECETLEKKWKEYIQGGVLRTYQVPSNKLCAALEVFSWIYRVGFKIVDDLIELTVKSPSLKDFEHRINKINQKNSIELSYIDVDFIINDEYEAFGIIRVVNDSQVIPLIGTSRIYFPEYIDIDSLHKYEDIKLPDGNEIFTQDEFSEMSKWRQASLIKAPSGNFYSFLDLYRNPKRIDPYTREVFPKSFIDEMINIKKSADGVFMSGFPPMNFDPELITIASGDNTIIRTISFYIRIGERSYTFWIIPDLRNTQYEQITLDAIQTLVIKWSDNSLFKGSFPYDNVIPDGDIHLLFSPIALYVFEETINNLNVEAYSQDIKAQAQHLSLQTYLLKICK